jgi:long-subunit acyl-CoA synthetase (AMP-forming)
MMTWHDDYLRWLYRGGRPNVFARLQNRASAYDPDMWAEIEASVHRVNATLSHIETVKEWRIPRDFTIGAGEVTPTSSPPQEVNDQYDRLVEEMIYAERS